MDSLKVSTGVIVVYVQNVNLYNKKFEFHSYPLSHKNSVTY